MAQYKVPQNVEADDKLLGPFSFRQFIYLLVAAGGVAVAVALFQIFPLLAVIPLPVVFFFAILALPLKKDQPMETYIAALISFYTKPRIRRWMTGQRKTTIEILSPKKKEESRSRDISEEEADHRLSFLAEVIDSGGQSVNQTMKDDFYTEANAVTDMLDANNSYTLNQQLGQATNKNHTEALQQMRNAIQESETPMPTSPHNISMPQPSNTPAQVSQTTSTAPTTNDPTQAFTSQDSSNSQQTPTQGATQQTAQQPTSKQTNSEVDKTQLEKLVKDNPDLSVSTIQKEADRREKKHKNEVYISLH